MVDGENFKQVPQFWNDCMNDGSYEWINSRAGERGVLGICKDFEFNYMIAIENIKETFPSGYISTTIPAATWAIFESVGALPEAIRILLEGYQHDCAP